MFSNQTDTALSRIIRSIARINAFVILILLMLSPAISLAQKPRMVLQTGHAREVNGAVFSADSKYVLTWSQDNTAKIWDAATGTLLNDLVAPNGNSGIGAASFGPGNRTVVSADDYTKVIIWAAGSGEVLHTIAHTSPGHDGLLLSTDHNVAKNKILTASADSAKVWDGGTGQLLLKLDGVTGLSFAKFTKDGCKIITGGSEGIRIWDAQTGKAVDQIGISGSIIHSAGLDRSEKMVFVGTENSVTIWDLSTKKQVYELAGSAGFRSAQLSENGVALVATADSTARVWDMQTGKRLISVKGPDLITRASLSNDGQKIVVGYWNGVLEVVDIINRKLLARLKGHSGRITGAGFNNDGSKAVSASGDGIAKVWDLDAGTWIDLSGKVTAIGSIAYDAPAGSLFLHSGGRLSSEAYINKWTVEQAQVDTNFRASAHGVSSITISPGGSKLAVELADKTVQVIDASSGKALWSDRGHGGAEVYSVGFDAEDKKLITGFKNGTAKIWDATTGKMMVELVMDSLVNLTEEDAFEIPQNSVYRCEFLPGNRVITVSRQSVIVWDAVSGQKIHRFVDSTDIRPGISLNIAANRVAIFQEDSTLAVYALDTYDLISRMRDENDQIMQADISPDGSFFLTSSWQKVKVREVKTGKLVKEFSDHEAAISWAEFLNDGRVLTRGFDSKAVIRDKDTFDLVRTIDVGPNNDVRIVDEERERIISTDNYGAHFFDINTGRKLWSFIQGDSGSHLSVIPSGYYKASPDAANMVYFVDKDLNIVSEKATKNYRDAGKVMKAVKMGK